MLLYENFLRGDAESLFDETGNTQRVFAMVSYGFNPRWQLTGFIVYIENQMENKTDKTLLPAFQVRYNPCHNLLIAAGAPLLFGLEWSLNSKLDFYFSQVMLDKTHLFLQYNTTFRSPLECARTGRAQVLARAVDNPLAGAARCESRACTQGGQSI